MERIIVYWIVLGLVRNLHCFNLDTENSVVHSGPSSSKFGFTVQQLIDQESKWLVVGAPEAETAQTGVYRPGAVYKCRADNPGQCNTIPFDTEGNNQEWNGYAYIQTENKTQQWLGASLSVSSENGAIVACAPRYVYFSRKGDKREPIGMCYVSSPDLESRFETYTPCKNFGYGYHRVGFCQAGFSAAISTDGSQFAMGAVGSFYWQGQVYAQSIVTKRHTDETNEAPPFSYADDSYMGYSMAKGEFSGDSVSDYVAGAPKGDGLLGRANVYDAEMKSLYNISGEQIGEYFGYAVTVGDFNGDNLDDIAIGAPFFTEFESTSFETGRVYVYYQTNRHKFSEKRDVLSGSKKRLSRFGLALSAVGDINNDGITDLIVGAPYDGEDDRSANGAIYVFHGSANGIITEISQVIHASQLNSRLRGFGFSIHGGLDFDGNHYPDILVGAVDSDKAVYLKTRPIIRISADLRVEPTYINLEQRNCELNDETSVTCFSIVTCMSYGGLGAPNEITLSMEWLLDDFRNLTQRAFFLGGSERETKHKKTMKIFQTNRCQTDVAYLKNGIRDKLTPIAVVLKYKLLESRVPRGQLKPLLDQYIPSAVTTLGHIKNDCGNNVCVPDLTVFVSKSALEYVMGSSHDIDMMIEVLNLGEDAFEAQLNIALPTGVDFRNIKNVAASQSQQCSSYKNESGQNYVLCDLGNPLVSRDYVRFVLKTKPKEKLIDPNVDLLSFSISANSSNPEDNSTISNNNAVVQIRLAVKTIIRVGGASKPEQVLYNSSLVSHVQEHEEDLGPEVVHLYEVRNLGPSDIKLLSVVIQWPAKLNDGQNHFLYLPEMPRIVRGKGYCTSGIINPENVTVSELSANGTNYQGLYDSGSKRRQRRDLEALRHRRLSGTHNDHIKEVDCSKQPSTDCAVIQCHVESMANGDVALVQVRARVWMQTVIEMQKEFRALEASSYATAAVVDVPYLMKSDNYSVNADNKVTTFVAAIDSGPGYQRVELWVIVLAIVGGCLLLFLLIILLWMCGFFRRKKAEEEDPDLLHKAELKPKPKNGMYESIPTEDL